jgi:hypothetical protein
MTQQLSAIARSGLLVSVAVSTYSGRKQDKRTQAEVAANKGSGSAKAASVYKNLFADCPELDDIIKFQARARARHYALTLPWNDNGLRLLPARSLLDYKAEMNRYGDEFAMRVGKFLDKYAVLVSAAAFKLGTLFDRDEYPMRDQIARKFAFTVDFAPLPTAGDFRVDVENGALAELTREYEQRMAAQVAAAQQDAWGRMYEALTRLKDRLTLDADGKRKVFHETAVTNAQELCSALTQLNITNDPALEAARQRLEEALMGVRADTLRKEEGERLVVLERVSSILDAVDFGGAE